MYYFDIRYNDNDQSRCNDTLTKFLIPSLFPQGGIRSGLVSGKVLEGYSIYETGGEDRNPSLSPNCVP